MSIQTLLRRSIIVLVLGTLFSVGVAAQSPEAGEQALQRWYASLSAGQLVNTEFDSSSVTFASNPFRIETTGNFDITGEWNWATTLGREFGRNSNFRLEGEFWGATVRREGFTADQLDVDLDDKLRARAIIANGLLRIVNSNRLKVWIGAGIGVADVRMLQAAGSTCNCLAEADGEGETYRIKMSFESRMDNGGAWFLEIGNVWLPDTETDTSLSSYTLHGKLTSAEVRIGYKISF